MSSKGELPRNSSPQSLSHKRNKNDKLEEFPSKTNNNKDYWNDLLRERTEGRFTRNMADLKEVLGQDSQKRFFRSALTQFCMSTGGQEGAGSHSNKASLAGSGYGFHKPPANFWKTLKAREILLLAKKMIKWKQPPFKRLMSSVSAKKRPGSPLWEHRVTSPPIRALRPSSAAPSWGGGAVLPWQMSLFHSQSSLTLFVCRIPLPSERRPLGGVTRAGEGVCAAGLGGPIHTVLRGSIFPSATQTQASGPNAAPGQCCQRWILWTVQPGSATVAISFFAEWDSLWWFTERQGTQCRFKDAPTEKAQIVGPFSQSK